MTLGVRGRRGALRSRGSDAGSARAGVASCLARTRRPGLRPAVARRLPTSPSGTRPALLRACPVSPSSSKKHTSRDSAERRSGPVRASVLGRGLPLRRHLFLRQRSRGGRDVNASALPPRDREVENAPAAAGRLRPRLRVSPLRLSPAFASFGSDASKKSVCVRSLSACRSSSWRPQSFYPPHPRFVRLHPSARTSVRAPSIVHCAPLLPALRPRTARAQLLEEERPGQPRPAPIPGFCPQRVPGSCWRLFAGPRITSAHPHAAPFACVYARRCTDAFTAPHTRTCTHVRHTRAGTAGTERG